MTPPQSPLLSSPACPNCGLPDTDRQDFCPSCGEYLRWDETAERPAPAAPPPAPTPAPAPVPAPVAAPPGPAPVLLVLDGGRPTVTAAAGGRASIAGIIRNQSGLVDNYDFRVTGVPAGWTTPPPTAYLLPFGSGDDHEQRFEVVLAPPRSPEAEAREWPIVIEAVSRSRGEVVARAQAALVVLPYHEVAMRARPQQRRSRRSARFDVELESRGNAPATIALTRRRRRRGDERPARPRERPARARRHAPPRACASRRAGRSGGAARRSTASTCRRAGDADSGAAGRHAAPAAVDPVVGPGRAGWR